MIQYGFYEITKVSIIESIVSRMRRQVTDGGKVRENYDWDYYY